MLSPKLRMYSPLMNTRTSPWVALCLTRSVVMLRPRMTFLTRWDSSRELKYRVLNCVSCVSPFASSGRCTDLTALPEEARRPPPCLRELTVTGYQSVPSGVSSQRLTSSAVSGCSYSMQPQAFRPISLHSVGLSKLTTSTTAFPSGVGKLPGVMGRWVL